MDNFCNNSLDISNDVRTFISPETDIKTSNKMTTIISNSALEVLQSGSNFYVNYKAAKGVDSYCILATNTLRKAMNHYNRVSACGNYK